MIVQLTNPSLTDELLSFLRRCPCDVQRIGATRLRVEVDGWEEGDRSPLLAGCCYRCGGEVEAPLSRLGSLACLDCRDGLASTSPGDLSRALLQVATRRESAEKQIRAFIRVWQALHPEGEGALRLVA
jgi:hypothetical protein